MATDVVDDIGAVTDKPLRNESQVVAVTFLIREVIEAFAGSLLGTVNVFAVVVRREMFFRFDASFPVPMIKPTDT